MPKSLPDALDLPIPKLVEADEDGEVKDPRVLLNGGTVRVCYDDMQPTDRITLNWPLAGSSYPPIEPQDGGGDGCINFYIPAQYIALRLDNFARFTYTVTRDGEEDQTSLEGEVRISLPYLPQVQVLKTINDELDLSLFCCKDPVICIPAWDFASTIQTINCYLSGIRPNGTKFGFYQYQHEPVTEEDVRDGWKRVLPQSVLRQFKHDSELYIFCTVRFSAVTPYRGFPGRTYTLLTEPHLDLSPPKLEEAVQTEFGWVLNPVNAVNGAHLVVAKGSLCSDDTVCPTLSGTPGPGSPPLECRSVGEGGTRLVFSVPPSAIRANFEQDIKLAYSVTRCDGSRWPSPERTVKVLGISGLLRPKIAQVTGTVLDLNTFNDDATGEVPIWSYAQKDDCCWMWIIGVSEDGRACRIDVLEGEPLTPAWLQGCVEAPISRAALQKLADCSEFELHFAANFNGACELETAVEFPVRYYTIEQEALVLPCPTVCEALGDQLTIWNGRNGVKVRVKYEGISRHHMIQAKWIKADGTSLPLESKPGNSDPGYVDFAIPREAVIQGAGKTILINYIVTSTCKLAPSKTLELKISVPTRLPTPVVRQATPPATQDGILDLRTFTGDADIDVEKWWFILLKQIGWMRGGGVLQNGNPYSFDVYLTKPVTDVDEGMMDIVLRSHLAVLKSGSHLTFIFNATPDGSTNESNAITFPSLRLIFLAGYYDFTTFDGGNRNGWLDGAASQGENRYTTVFSKSCIVNGTASSGTAGIILYKDVTGLEVGRSYRFSMLGCTYNGAAPLPQLSLRTNAGAVTAVTTFTAMAWRKIEGTFVASSSSMQLQVVSHLASGASGNDFAMTDLLVEDL